jgi:signal transduction histidine kinase
VTEERLRIAREIHDIVSHNLSLIAVQAGVANHVAAEQPEQARAALASIEAISRGALTEVRGVLGVLRNGATDLNDRQPTPGLNGLEELAERARASGVTVDVHVDVGHPLAAGIERAIYRIVQEALTNVVQHAAPARCTVHVSTDGENASVHVTDNGRRMGRRSGGHGLVGIRERVMMYGGQLTAGPNPDGGFTLHATMPYRRTVDL